MSALRSQMFTTVATLALSVLAVQAKASTLFFDSLQGNLSQFSSNGSGVIKTDPTGGQALAFTAAGSGGDLFTNYITGSSAGNFILSFYVLGNCGQTSGCGGFIGIDQTVGGEHWLTSDTSYPGLVFPFADTTNNTYTHVSFGFNADSSFRIKLEDFGGSPNFAPSSVYFKDLALLTGATTPAPTPEPATLSLVGLGIAGAGMLRRRLAKA